MNAHPALERARAQLQELAQALADAADNHDRGLVEENLRHQVLAPLQMGMAGGMMAPADVCRTVEAEATRMLDQLFAPRAPAPAPAPAWVAPRLAAALDRLAQVLRTPAWEATPPATDHDVAQWQARTGLVLPADLRAVATVARRFGPSGSDCGAFDALPMPYGESVGESNQGFAYDDVDGSAPLDYLDACGRLPALHVGDGSFLSCVVVPGFGLRWLDDDREGPQGFVTQSTADVIEGLLGAWHPADGTLARFFTLAQDDASSAAPR